MELLTPSAGLIIWTLLAVVLPLVALVSLVRSKFKDSTTKLVWLLLILFVPIAGALFYFLIGKQQRIKTVQP